MPKIIIKDNFDRDHVSERVLCENVSEFYGKAIVEFLIDKFSGNDSPYYYVLKPDDYVPYEFEP